MSLNGTSLFEFEWSRARGGYALDAPLPPPRTTSEDLAQRFLRPIGPHVEDERYRPDEVTTGLHRYFINRPATAEGMLEFVDGYGLLSPETDSLDQMLRAHRDLMLFSKMLDTWPASKSLAVERRASFDGRPLATLAELWNQYGRAHADVRIDTSKPKSLRLRVVPRSLLSYLWLKFADELTGGVIYRLCQTCKTPMELRSLKHQHEKLFCSTACRMVAYRTAKKGKAQ